MVVLVLTGCRKDYLNGDKNQVQFTNGYNPINDPMLEYRWLSPYSIKTVREVRALAQYFDDTTKVKIVTPLKSQNYYLYYRITPDNSTKADALNTWLDGDSNRVVVPYPLDSISLYPQLFPENVLEELETEQKNFYTTVPLSEPLPSGMSAQLIDTLYLPDSTERVLDFVLNLATANLSGSYITFLQNNHPAIHQAMSSIYTLNAFIPYDDIGNGERAIDSDWSDPGAPGFSSRKIYFKQVTDVYYDGDRMFGHDLSIIRSGGKITFRENTLNVDEGIKGLKVATLRYVIIPYFTTTDEHGAFESDLPNRGHCYLSYMFYNKHSKIRSIDYTSIGSGILSTITYLMTINVPVLHTKFVDPRENINDVNTHFEHGSKKALWGITFNTIQTANDYAVLDGLTSYSPIDFKILNVMCYYKNSTGRSSAPMLSYIGSGGGVGVTNIIFHTFGLSSLFGNSVVGILPDMIISQSADTPSSSRGLRETIFHEYGHSLHYFKANKFTNAHWLANISKTLGSGSGYGDDIEDSPGDFFALSEGWADFIGHYFGSKKYPTPFIFNDRTANTERTAWIYNETGTYLQHLENNPTFYNSFIPRGLFWDLMDGGSVENHFDNISGHTIEDIYNRFNDNTWTIQKFRERWEDEYPSVNNAALFNWYNIDLP